MKSEIFQSRLSSLSGDTLAKYSRTVAALESFLVAHAVPVGRLTPSIVEDWTYELLRQGKAVSTVARHLNILSSLLKETPDGMAVSAARRARELARSLGPDTSSLPPLMRETVFTGILSLLKSWLLPDAPRVVAQDLLLFSLLNGAAPVDTVARLRKDDMPSCCGVASMILERNQSPHRDFIFDLRQSYRTPRQLRLHIAGELHRVLAPLLGLSSFDADEAVRSIWAAMAIHCGATPSEALGALGDSAPLAVPKFCTPASEVRSGDARRLWDKAIGGFLRNELPRWYAMQMRRGVTFSDIQKAVAENIHPAPELFYPCETITRNLRSRKVITEQPFIAQTVFFRVSPDRILPMFGKIGDKAWCYRIFNSPSAPYATISQEEMKRFQAAIGQFTPDLEVRGVGEIPVSPGDSVILLMPGFSNRQATVRDIITDGSGSVIYRVMLDSDHGIEWRVDVDPRRISTLPKR